MTTATPDPPKIHGDCGAAQRIGQSNASKREASAQVWEFLKAVTMRFLWIASDTG
ncbi:hypothetical protein GMA10_08735 [Kocuria koreensis]|jgi:oligoribonuclease (3'-5' exoribonuclease)|uniref:Uncharacterized protein n=1 Tax=Rothia koreensis TaxID=592378 RepID=A0A7K1LJK7_9MICC|nr:hypothetical protein [Rothia koreensis]MUN55290.1 hypothetical protein [Rothia koreensis]